MKTHRSVTVAKKLLDEAINKPGMRTNGPLYVSVPADILNSLIILATTPYWDWSLEEYNEVQQSTD